MSAKRPSNARTGTGTLFGRAAIYARISLDKVAEAAGVGRQIDACRHLADLESWSVDEVLVDNDLSAYSGACRAESERLLDLVRRREIDVIVAYHPDLAGGRQRASDQPCRCRSRTAPHERTNRPEPQRPRHLQRPTVAGA